MRKLKSRNDTLTLYQVVRESSRCLFCNDAPCNAGCPAGIDVAGFIRRIKDQNLIGAARKIREKNVLAITCGWRCPSERFCEAKCSSTQLTERIKIKALHRFAADFELRRGLRPPETAVSKGDIVAVIGSGPSGLACAAELGRLGYEVTIFEELPVPGGALVYFRPLYKLPKDIVQAEIDYVAQLNVHFKFNTHIKGRSAVEGLFQQGYKAIFIGVGLGKVASLDIPKQDLKKIHNWRELISWFKVGLGKALSLVIGGQYLRRIHSWRELISWFNINNARYIAVNKDTGETSCRGIFAGGDAIRGAGTIVQSIHDGLVAARGIDSYLQMNKTE